MPIGIKAKKAAQKHASRSHIEVTHIIRHAPFMWRAEVEYTYRSTTWQESVRFAVTELDDGRRVVAVCDAQYPQDRALTMHLDRHDARPIPQVIIDFLIAGRW